MIWFSLWISIAMLDFACFFAIDCIAFPEKQMEKSKRVLMALAWPFLLPLACAFVIAHEREFKAAITEGMQ